MADKPVRCPGCNKILAYYIEGNAVLQLKCRHCKRIIRIYSAGKTAIYTEVNMN